MSDKAGRTPNPSNSGLSTPQGINYLLAIGIDMYQHCPRLYNCIKDAQEFIQLLNERYRFDAQNIHTVFNEKATRGNIYRAFREMAQRVTPQDNLLIYFSGHGEYDNIFKEGYWIPVEAQAGNYDQYIPNSEIRTFLAGINSHHTFLMSDSCFAGALFAKGLDKNIEKRYENDPSRWGLTAGRNEVVSDGKPGDNSPFAESLLYRLRQNTDALGVQELCAYVTEYVQAKTNQTPIGEPLRVEGHKNGQFVFHLKKDENRDWTATQQENSIAAYEHFLLAYPDGRHTEEARSTLAFLKEETAWQQARTTNTIASYDYYLQQYRQGRYRRTAIDAQKTLEETEAWERAKQRNTISAYREFQYNYQDSKHYNEAETRIQKLQPPPVQPIVPPVQRTPEPTKEPSIPISEIPETILMPPAPDKNKMAAASPTQEIKKAAPTPIYKSSEPPITTAPKKNNLSYLIGGTSLLLILTFVLVIWQPWKTNKPANTTNKSAQEQLKDVAETNAYELAKKANTLTAFNDFLNLYPNGVYAYAVKKEIYNIQEHILKELKDALAFINGESYEEAKASLEAATRLGSNKALEAQVYDALDKKEFKRAKRLMAAAIQLQNQKVTPPAPPLGK